MALRYLPALALLDSQQHALTVDVAHLEHADLGDAQAGAVGDRQHSPVLEAGCGLQQPRDPIGAEHDEGRPAVMGEAVQLAGEIGGSSVRAKRKRSAETMLFMVGARIALLDLEPPHVLAGHGNGGRSRSVAKRETSRM